MSRQNEGGQQGQEPKPLEIIANRIESARSRIHLVAEDIEAVASRLNGSEAPRDSGNKGQEPYVDSTLLSGISRLIGELEEATSRLEDERSRLTKIL